MQGSHTLSGLHWRSQHRVVFSPFVFLVIRLCPVLSWSLQEDAHMQSAWAACSCGEKQGCGHPPSLTPRPWPNGSYPSCWLLRGRQALLGQARRSDPAGDVAPRVEQRAVSVPRRAAGGGGEAARWLVQDFSFQGYRDPTCSSLQASALLPPIYSLLS